MPLLVRLTDSQVEVTEHMVSQLADCVYDGGRIPEQVRAVGLAVHE